jgi:hypothetical protein
MSWGLKPCLSASESGHMTPFFIPYLSVRIRTLGQLNIYLETSLELDSHADTTVLRAGALIIQSYDQPVEVVGYDPQQGS